MPHFGPSLSIPSLPLTASTNLKQTKKKGVTLRAWNLSYQALSVPMLSDEQTRQNDLGRPFQLYCASI